MIKGVLFDMDGVLVDNAKIHYDAFKQFCARYGVAGWDERFTSLYGMGNDDIMRCLMPSELIERVGTQALSDEKEALYRQIYAPIIQPVAGLREFLSHLQQRGIRLAVGSSGCRDNVEFVLDTCHLGDFFAPEARVSGDMVTHCKPDPEIYLTAASRLGLKPADCLVFEDAKAGVEAARRAGVSHVIALATSLTREELSATEAAYVVRDFTEVTDDMLQIKR